MRITSNGPTSCNRIGGRRRLAARTAMALAAAATACATGGPAQAAPVAVQQTPAFAFADAGLQLFKTYQPTVRIDTAGPGAVWFSAPANPTVCFTRAGESWVTLRYTNVTTGRAGVTSVRACSTTIAGPRRVKIAPGPGLVIGTFDAVGTGILAPTAPGTAVFRVG
ncbi:hypothetical protein HH308_12665 [Gordonia sp. TBRC 11910]|uniref:Secreted protein n=1 Tax=Gordonia asplenii TaxID=2725283 RepID=A0A848KSY6_9ACTN|nr:hypothetical protein [Gordonia asplenii]NMO02064.1 hypothetical protein [Gordonia asplenii]